MDQSDPAARGTRADPPGSDVRPAPRNAATPADADAPAEDRTGWRGWLDRPAAWPALAGLGLGLLALGPGLGRGYLLSYDMVFVPRMPFSAALIGLTGGPPRAVPSDAVVAAASRAIPADILQKLILLLIFVLACSGAAALLDSGWSAANRRARRAAGAPLAARLAAGVFYAWNPYLAERLLIGQWAMLLGYAALPWLIKVLSTGPARIRPGRLLIAAIPAAVGGFAAMSVAGLGAVVAAPLRGTGPGERGRRLAGVLVVLAILGLPWLIPAFGVPVHTDPRGAEAFVARADTAFGRLGSLVMLSGIWNAQTVPRGYGGGASAIWLLVVIAALGGYVALARTRRVSPGLGVAALVGLVIAAAGASGPGQAVLRDLTSAWAGFADLRDGQQYLAPLALAEAVGLGALVAWLPAGLARGVSRAETAPGPGPAGTPAASRSAGSGAVAALSVMAVLAPVLLLPGLAWGVAGRLRPVEYPADWLRARQVIDSGPARGSVLLLPWAAYRRFPWNGGEAVYDPWTRFLSREVISSDALQIGNLVLSQESPDSIRLNRIVTRPGPLTGALRTAGVRYVVVDAGPLLAAPRAGLAAAARLPRAQVVISGPDLVVFRLSPEGGADR
jgi:hypothetical protein